MGVPSRPRLFEARQAIRLYEAAHHTKVQYVVAKPQMALYEKVSAKIYSIYLKYIAAQDIHVYSIDEVFIEATHYMQLYGKEATEAGMSTPHFLTMKMMRRASPRSACFISTGRPISTVAFGASFLIVA